jgi:hypothetical protein
MKTLSKILLALTAVAALSLAYPASVQAVPTTYHYTGNHFTDAHGPYTTSDFVTAMVTLAGPLGANMPLTEVHPIAFTVTDGVQTITQLDTRGFGFFMSTDAFGHIAAWRFDALLGPDTGITSDNLAFAFPPLRYRIHHPWRLWHKQLQPRDMGRRTSRVGRGVYPIIDDADPYGVGSSGPTVPAGSGLTAPGLGRSRLLAFRH